MTALTYGLAVVGVVLWALVAVGFALENGLVGAVSALLTIPVAICLAMWAVPGEESQP